MSVRLGYRLQLLYSLLSERERRRADALVERYHRGLAVLDAVASQLGRVRNKHISEAVRASVVELAVAEVQAARRATTHL